MDTGMSLGIDSIEIERIRRSMMRPRFLEKHFSREERDYFASRNFAPATVAGHFAAKEAFSKALGTGVRGFALDEAAVLHDELGKPYFALCGRAAALCPGRRPALSITHTKTTATAVVCMLEEVAG